MGSDAMPEVVPPRSPLHRAVRAVLWLSLAAAALLLLMAAALRIAGVAKAFGGQVGNIRPNLLLTLAALAAGAALLEVLFRSGRTRLALAAAAALLTSQVCYHWLLWSGWKGLSVAGRVWWVSMVAAVALTHLSGLRLLKFDARGLIDRAVPWAAALAGALFAAPGLLPRPLDMPAWYLYLATAPGAVSLIGTAVLWRRRVRRARGQPPARPMSTAAKVGLVAATHVFLFGAGLYIGRVYPSGAGEFGQTGALAGLLVQEVDARVAHDLPRLRRLAEDMDDLEARVGVFQEGVRARMAADGREYFKPDEDDEVRRHFRAYLSMRSELLRMVAVYADFPSVKDPDAQARCFLTGFAAAATLMRTSLAMVLTYRDRAHERRKLDEEEPRWDIPGGMFSRVYESVISSGNAELFDQMAARYRERRGAWRDSAVLPAADLDWLEDRIDASVAWVQAHSINRRWARLGLLKQKVVAHARSPIYVVQSMAAEVIGDTQLLQRPPFISADAVDAEIRPRLQPGDILLERRNWYASNAFLPGFWPHAALYLGTEDDLRQLDERLKKAIPPEEWKAACVLEDAEVRRRLEAFRAPAPDGRANDVIEAVSEGVIFNSLTHTLSADYAAALRPRVTDRQRAEAIKRAFSHHGKRYDYEFDFATSDRLVCTELVYRSYGGMLDFKLVRVMGRDTLPAVEMVRQFREARGTPAARMDFVLFMDAQPGEDKASLADEDAFCGTAERPRAFNE
jgi:hypothetical protein